MLEKKAANFGIVLRNLGKQRRELADQRQQETRLGSYRDGVRLQLSLLQLLPEYLGGCLRSRMVM